MSDEQPIEPRNEAWVTRRFGDVGPAPSNEVEPDPRALPSPNIERPCVGEVADD